MKKVLLFILGLLLITCNTVRSEDIDINAFVNKYGQEVQNIIKSNLKYTGSENAISSVTYKIHPDGSVTDIKLDRSSGTDFDKAVIEAVQKSAPFKPFPKGINLADIVMTSGFQHKVEKVQSARMSIMPVEPSEAVQQVYKQYIDKVSKYIFDRIPTTYNYIPQEPVIKCKILKDGTLTDFQVAETSGIAEYDRKIVETYSGMKVAPFPKELSMYAELPFSVRMYRQYRTRPVMGTPGFIFR